MATKSTLAAKPTSKTQEPIWIKSPKTGEATMQLADGKIATLEEAQKFVFWPSIRLRIHFGGWYRYYRSSWQKAVAAFTVKFIKFADFTWVHQETDPISHWIASVLRPTAFNRATVTKWIQRNIFRSHPENPMLLLRTGDKYSVIYEKSLLLYHDRVEFYLPPTTENVQFLEKLLDELVKNELADKVSFQYADISYGLAGWLYPFTQFTKNIKKMYEPEKDSPIFGSSWLVWIGDLWLATPKHQKHLEILQNQSLYTLEEKYGFKRITTTRPSSYEDVKSAESAKRLTEGLKTVIKKMAALDWRLLEPIIEREEKALLKKLKKS